MEHIPPTTRLSTLYATVVSQNISPGPPYLNPRRTIASFQTNRSPKVPWIKVFMCAFGFAIANASDASQPQLDWSREPKYGYKFQVEVRGSHHFPIDGFSLIYLRQDDAQNMRLARYLHGIDDRHRVHNSTETGTPWHVEPHAAGASYMQCSTFKAADEEFYQTTVSERRNGSDSALLKIMTAVLPEAGWLKVYGEAAGMTLLNQPESLQVLASRVSGRPIPGSS